MLKRMIGKMMTLIYFALINVHFTAELKTFFGFFLGQAALKLCTLLILCILMCLLPLYKKVQIIVVDVNYLAELKINYCSVHSVERIMTSTGGVGAEFE